MLLVLALGVIIKPYLKRTLQPASTAAITKDPAYLVGISSALLIKINIYPMPHHEVGFNATPGLGRVAG